MAHLHDLPEESYAIFRLKSPSGDQGFPGALAVRVLIALVAPEKTGLTAEIFLGSIVIHLVLILIPQKAKFLQRISH